MGIAVRTRMHPTSNLQIPGGWGAAVRVWKQGVAGVVVAELLLSRVGGWRGEAAVPLSKISFGLYANFASMRSHAHHYAAQLEKTLVFTSGYLTCLLRNPYALANGLNGEQPRAQSPRVENGLLNGRSPKCNLPVDLNRPGEIPSKLF